MSQKAANKRTTSIVLGNGGRAHIASLLNVRENDSTMGEWESSHVANKVDVLHHLRKKKISEIAVT
jgi:hypothetical protein